MKSKSVRAAGIVLAVILGVAALLYLGGLISQLTIGYQKWLADGGMTGKATMGTIYFSPLACWRSAMTGSGLKCTLFTAVLAGGLFAFVRLQNRFGSNDYDPRNFTRSKRGTYGTSGWMSEEEMRSVLEVAGPERAKGIILGKTERGSVICLPEDTRLNKHIAVFGASGTMKSRGVIRPALFQSIRRGESVVVADPKSEMFADTAELFKKHGYKVRVYNLLQPKFSDSWNCMFDLGGDTLMAQILTDVIISNTKGDEKGDHFWDNGESNLLKSLILYVDLDSTRTPEERNLAAVYQMLTQHTEKELTMLFDRLPIGHPAKGPYSLFSQASDTVRAGIVLGLGTRLQVLQSEAVRRITRSSDIDLSEPGWSKCAYYIILDDQNSSLEFLSALFFAFLFIKLVRYADSTPEQRCKVPVNIILDEMNNIGTIKDFGRRLSTIRSRALQVIMCSQSLPQLQNRYPNNLWAELLGGYTSGGGQIVNPDADWIGTGIFQWPLPQSYTITSWFGYREDPFTGEIAYHSGTDIAAPEGTPILAAADGTVTIANAIDSWGGGYGYHIKVKHNDTYETLYAHCSSICVTVGQEVKQGEVIGYVGTTGNSTGNHLHFEVWQNGERTDALGFFKAE